MIGVYSLARVLASYISRQKYKAKYKHTMKILEVIQLLTNNKFSTHFYLPQKKNNDEGKNSVVDGKRKEEFTSNKKQ